MRVDLFDFDLPTDRIALYPAHPRDASRLLYVGAAGLEDRKVAELTDILRSGDLLVFNDTKVIPAQLKGVRQGRETGPPVEIEATLHKDIGNDVWRAFVRPARRLRAGDVVDFGGGLRGEVRERDGAEAIFQFAAQQGSFDAALNAVGAMPLPPYIARKRAVTDEDRRDYQTIFAEESGSVAAPTAGLHFTDQLLRALGKKGVEQLAITLHVGAGTFLPVSVDETQDHKMHEEWGEITPEQAERINQRRSAGGRVIAVGTTSLRLLESASDEDGQVRPWAGETDIFITPGYRFKAIDMLMTNFHLPRSTLFMLVCAVAGIDEMKAAYRHAIDKNYRFYSYGDACLLELKDGR